MPFPTRTPPYEVEVKNWPSGKPDPKIVYKQAIYNGVQGTIFTVPPGTTVRILGINVQATSFPAVASTLYLQVLYPYPDPFAGTFPIVVPFSHVIPASEAWIACAAVGLQRESLAAAAASWIEATSWPDIPLTENMQILMNTGTVATFFAWIYYHEWATER